MAAQSSSAVKPVQAESDTKIVHEASEAAAHLAAAAHLIGTDDPALAAFFTAFTRYASPEDLTHYTGPEFAALIKRVFTLWAQRPSGTPLVEIFDPSLSDPGFARSEMIVVAVNDDIPFLYDSCTGEVRAQGMFVTAALHPVIAVARDGKG